MMIKKEPFEVIQINSCDELEKIIKIKNIINFGYNENYQYKSYLIVTNKAKCILLDFKKVCPIGDVGG